MKRPRIPSAQHSQRGVATLVVVMVLFFIISLVAAYTNRNLIFEQRTSANQYRSTQALETAEAGLEWALAMLNHGKITATCLDSASVGDSSFRDRYVIIDPTTGKFTPQTQAGGAELLPSCVYNGTQWDCSCPDTGNPVLTPPVGTAVYPAFRIRMRKLQPTVLAPPQQPGAIWVEAVGCTRLDAGCLTFSGQGTTNEGRAVVSTIVALTGNAASVPFSAVTARGSIGLTAGNTLTAYNTLSTDSGITFQAGQAIGATAVAFSTPGTPSSASIIQNDPALDPTIPSPVFTADRMFAAVFNMWPASFQGQPAAYQLACGGGTCTAADVRTAVSLNPKRPIWVQGNLLVNSSGNIGTVSEPVLLIVNGDLTFSVTGVTIFGLAYMRTANWALAGAGDIQGAVVAEDNITGTGATTVTYNADVLRRLRQNTGSLVRLPGSWRDFQ